MKDNKDEKKLELYQNLDSFIEEYKDNSDMLIKVLKQAQDIFGYLTEEVQCHISQKLAIPISEVNGVVTFYSLFSTSKKGVNIISICMGTACYVKGAPKIINKIKNELNIDIDQTTEDGLFTLKSSRCVGACGIAPVVTINDYVYGKVKEDEIVGLINKYKTKEGVGV